MTKKKVFAYKSMGFRSQKKKNKQMVSPQNGDIRGGPPPPSNATAFFAFLYKIRANTQQVLPLQTGLYRYVE